MAVKDGQPNQEDILADFVKRLRKHSKGRLAIHIHLSRLAPENQTTHIIREAAACFHGFIKQEKGQLFRLTSGDLVFISKDVSVMDMDSTVMHIRAMVRHDPMLRDDRSPDPRHDVLVDWYDLEQDYDPFLDHIEQLRRPALASGVHQTSSENIEAAAPALPRAVDAKRPPETVQIKMAGAKLTPSPKASYIPISAPEKPVMGAIEPDRDMTPVDLDRLESNFRHMDPSPFIVPRTVAAMISDDGLPHVVFHEQHLSYAKLQQAVLPHCDIKADLWLFLRLAQLLEARLFKNLKFGNAVETLAFAFPCNVNVILSDQFFRFDRERKRATNRPIIFEIRLLDAMQGLRHYLEARERVLGAGYRICLHGLDAFDFMALNREQTLADFEKIEWRADYETSLAGNMKQRFIAAFARAGRGRLILSNCDSKQAISWGRDAGFTLFQGPYIEHLLKEGPAQKRMA